MPLFVPSYLIDCKSFALKYLPYLKLNLQINTGSLKPRKDAEGPLVRRLSQEVRMSFQNLLVFYFRYRDSVTSFPSNFIMIDIFAAIYTRGVKQTSTLSETLGNVGPLLSDILDPSTCSPIM